MKGDPVGTTIRWGIGGVVPMVLVGMAVYSFGGCHDARTLWEAGSRLDFGNVSRGTASVVMGIGYLGLASFLVGWLFQPLRRANATLSVWLEIIGFVLGFSSLAFVCVIAKML